ncbi:hypothetical protein SUGI_1524990, partial [Cryptomeria japonica]
TIRNKMLEGRF